MKKYLSIVMFCVLLTGCGAAEETLVKKEMNMQSAASDSEQDKIVCALPETTIYYDSEAAFLASDFCAEMQQKGYTPYLLSYDEERYEFCQMWSDASFYVYSLIDKTEDEGVTYTISYETYERTATELNQNKADKSGDSIVTVEKDGMSYDVYISKSPYIDYDRYSIQYLPFMEYKVSIHAGATTPEAALAYIHEFDLVPAVAQESTSEEIPAETSAE